MAAALAVASVPLGAQTTVIWNNGTANWSAGGNWSGNSGNPPGASDFAQVGGGTVSLDGAILVGKLTLTGGTIAGSGTLTLSGSGSTWQGGSIAGSAGQELIVGTGADLNLSTSTTKSLSFGKVTNQGTVTWSGGSLYSGNGAVIDNRTGATFAATFGGTVYHNLGGTRPVFTNAGTFTKTGAGTTTTLHATFNNTGRIDVDSGDLTFSGGGSSTGIVAIDAGNKLRVDTNSYTFGHGATLDGPGTIEIAGAATFSGTNGGSAGLSIVSGGTATFAASGTTTLSGPISLASGGTIDGSGTLVASPAFTWTGGDLKGGGLLDLNAGGTFSTASTKSLHDRDLTLTGTLAWTGGSIYSGGGSTLTIESGGTFSAELDNTLYFNLAGDRATIVNQGTLRKHTGDGTTELQAIVNNQLGATMTVTTGTLLLSGGGTSSGTVAIAADKKLRLATNAYTFGNGATLNGPGTIEIAVPVTFSGTNGGTAALSIVSGGTASIGGTTSVGAVSLGGGIVGGGGVLNASGGLVWSSGDLIGGGTLQASGATFSTGSTKSLYAHTLILDGNSQWTGGSFYTGGGSTITNKPGFTFSTNTDQVMYANLTGPQATLSNQGTFVKTAGTGSTTFHLTLNNSGTIRAQTGRIALSGGGTNSSSASLLADTGAEILIDNSFTLQDGSILNGAGTVRFTNGNLTANGSLLFGLFKFEGGALIGTQELQGQVEWRGGNWNATALGPVTTVAAGATLTLVETTSHDFNYRQIANRGTINWNGNYIRSGYGGSLVNEAGAHFNDLTASGTQYIYSDSNTAFTFTNHGTFTKSGASTTELDIAFNNHNAVIVNAGRLRLTGGGANAGTGTFSTGSGATTEFGNSYSVGDGSSLTGAGTYQLSNGTLTVTGNVAVGTFNQTGGKLGGSQTFTAGTFNWNGGDWNATAAGPTTRIGSGAILNLNTSTPHDFNYRAVTNEGIVNWYGHYLRSGFGGSFTNAAGAQFKDMTPSGMNYIYSDSNTAFTFTNHGTYTKSGAGTTEMRALFNNHKDVVVSAGRLQLTGGGTNAGSGTFSTAASAFTEFAQSYTIADGSSLTGAGTYQLSGGTLTVNGNIAVSNFSQTGGRLAGSQTFTSGTFNWSGGNWDTAALGPTTTIGSGATLNLLNSSPHDFNYRAVTNQGIVNWHGHYFRSGFGGSFTNATSANFNDLTGAGINYIYSESNTAFTFTNNGTYTKSGAGTTEMRAVFNNNKDVVVSAGRLQITGGGTNSGTGTFSTAASAFTEFAQNYTIANGSSLTGAGTYQLTNGTLTINGNIAVSNFSQTGGTLAGSQTFTSGTFAWSGGDWNTNALGPTTIIGSAATLNLLNSSPHDFNYRAVTNQGIVNWHGHYFRSGHGGSFTNAPTGKFNDLTGAGTNYIYSDSNTAFSFANQGTYTKSGIGTTELRADFTNSGALAVNSGVLQFTNAFSQLAGGSIDVAAGASIAFNQGLTLAAGTLRGAGTVIANVTNSGQLSPGNSPGQLTITGNLTLLGTSSLLIELGGTTAGSGYDVLAVSGSAALGGGLELKFVNGFQLVAQANQTFTILTSAALSGSFANIASGARLLTSDGFGSFRVNYGPSFANSIVLSDFQAIPEPSTYAMLGAGALAILYSLRRRSRR